MIKSLYLAPILAISLSGLATATNNDGLFARLEVRTGRVQVIQDDTANSTLRRGEDLSVRGATHLEVSSGSEVRISYPGVASMHIWGPASLDWQSVPTQSTSNLENLETLSSGGIAWNVFSATWCDLEVRRGRHLLNMPGDWSAVMQGGSVRMRGLTTGPLEVRVNAGDPLQLFWSGDESQARPPLTVYPGSNLRLERPTQAKVDQSGNAVAWQKPAWPYRRSSETLAQNTARQERVPTTRKAQSWPELSPAANLDQTQAQVGFKPPVERVQVTVEPQRFAQRQPVVPQRNVVQRQAPVVQTTRQPVASQPVQPVVRSVPQANRGTAYVADHWRNVSLNKLISCGAVVVEDRPGVETRVFAGGRRKVLVDRFDGSSTWVFGQDKDHHLLPGSVAVFDEKGKLVLSHGNIETYAAKGLRPNLSSIK
ncbi:MAG: hypothetical protein P1V35_08880 [Planctomycetota bacterium]|nr:hypothetical protein [Planctomycetota bacterium]